MRSGPFLSALLLLAGAAGASEPAALGGHTLRGEGRLRIDARSGAERAEPVLDLARVYVRLGPSDDCLWPLAGDELVLSLVGGYSLVLATGSLGSDAKGRTALALDPGSLADELGQGYRAACEQSAPPSTCAELLDGLEARLVRSDLRLKAAAGRVRLRGKVELALVDPLSGRTEGTWSLSFRDVAGLEALPPAPADCGDDGGGSLTLPPLPH
jgi:hypothetical protein